MRRPLCKSAAGFFLAALPAAALAAPALEDMLVIVGKVPVYAFIVFVIVIGAVAFFMKLRDKRATPVNKVFEENEAIHSVRTDALVIDCVRKMAAERIGALIVMDGEKLAGIFTERDALNKVLAAGLDPGKTRIAEVMTSNPYCIPPGTTVGEAMELVTKRRVRHLPVVDNGKVIAVVSSGDLTHWMVKDQLGEVKELVDLAAKS